MSEFKRTVAGYREALKQEGARSAVPGLDEILRRENAPETPQRLLWAMAVASLVAMAAVPVYQSERQKRAVEQDQADRLLLEQVNESLSQPVAGALAPLLGLGN